MKLSSKIFRVLFKTGLVCGLLGLMGTAALSLYLNPQLPAVDTLRSFELQTPLKIYTADERLIAEFGEKRRTPLTYDKVPPLFVKAIMAAEDDGFEQHPGVDIKGLLRAAYQLATSGSIQSGGSTITMQVARNYFLTLDQTFSRKFNEILLALQIEQELSKAEIMELYVNKIFLGNRAYGIQAAASVYYGKTIDKLNLAQLAMIAGLPKAPSAYNPVANPTRAKIRRDWILQRMQNLGYITEEQKNEALAEPVTAAYFGQQPEVDAPYLAEMVRTELLKTYDAEYLYTTGLRVFTTIDSRLQQSANQAVISGLLEYDQRHGYRGPEAQLELPESLETDILVELLDPYSSVGDLIPALVISITDNSLEAIANNGETIRIDWDGMNWARPYLSANAMGSRPSVTADIVQPGDVIRVVKDQDLWTLSQIPAAQSALVSVNSQNGAIQSLVGGFNYQQSKFNRVTSALRQPGSNFKPFIYSAALANGYTAASLINDAPVVFDDPQLEAAWRPENDSGEFYGPTRLRQALYLSRNLVSIRLLRAIGVQKAIDYVARFGFEEKRLPHDLSLALGSADFTPLEIVTGYATLANGGYKIEPYFIDRVQDTRGNLLYSANPVSVCRECEEEDETPTELAGLEAELELAVQQEAELMSSSSSPVNSDSVLQPVTLPDTLEKRLIAAPRVMDPRITYIIDNMLKDVVLKGTGKRALSLDRGDIGGKTGTTNDQVDAWFSGYNPDIVTTVWVGFDQPSTLGRSEFGSSAALPIWIEYMAEALRGKPEVYLQQPPGLVTLRIDPDTGLPAKAGQSNAIFEIFRTEYAPKTNTSDKGLTLPEESTIPEQLF